MTDNNQRDCLEEFASELDTPRAGDLADFEPELSTDEADAAVAPSAVAEHSATSSVPAEKWSRTRAYPDAASSSRTDGGLQTSGTTRRRYGIASLLVAAGAGAVVTAAGFAGYLLHTRTPARAEQPAPPTETARNGHNMIASDKTNHQTTLTGEAAPAVRPGHRESVITSSGSRSRSGSVEGTAQGDPTGGLPSENLTGWWTLTNDVHATNYRRYLGLRLVYRLRLRQDGYRISGHGQKWAENDRPIPRAGRTPIEVAGTLEGRRLVLTFTERGLRRTSGGAFELTVMDDGRLSGTFQSDAAQSSGTSIAQRGDGPREGQL